jgi:hypothetical protein
MLPYFPGFTRNRGSIVYNLDKKIPGGGQATTSRLTSFPW